MKSTIPETKCDERSHRTVSPAGPFRDCAHCVRKVVLYGLIGRPEWVGISALTTHSYCPFVNIWSSLKTKCPYITRTWLCDDWIDAPKALEVKLDSIHVGTCMCHRSGGSRATDGCFHNKCSCMYLQRPERQIGTSICARNTSKLSMATESPLHRLQLCIQMYVQSTTNTNDATSARRN